MAKLTLIHRTILLASFSIWFGGFGFYASIVVPIGTRVLNSARQQGMITQQVTNQLNVFCAIAIAMMLVESKLSWKHLRRSARNFQLGLVITILVSLASLIFLHRVMDQLIDPDSLSIVDGKRFYLLHRIYLWTSTIQWIAGWIWIAFLVRSWRGRD